MKKIILTAGIIFTCTALFAQQNNSDMNYNREGVSIEAQTIRDKYLSTRDNDISQPQTQTVVKEEVKSNTTVNVNGRTPNMGYSTPKNNQQYERQATNSPISNGNAQGTQLNSNSSSIEKERLERSNRKGPDKNYK